MNMNATHTGAVFQDHKKVLLSIRFVQKLKQHSIFKEGASIQELA